MSSEHRMLAQNDSVFAREANHRIANHLAHLASQVQTQVRTLQKPEEGPVRLDAVLVLRDVVAKIVALGNHHRRLAERPETDRVELGEYLVESCSSGIALLSRSDRVAITYRLDGDCMVTSDVAHALALVANEIVLNAAKHAHPTGLPVAMSIDCTASGGRTVLEIADDGVGLPEGFDPARDGGVGFQVVRALAASAGADLTIESDSLGLSFRLSLADGRR